MSTTTENARATGDKITGNNITPAQHPYRPHLALMPATVEEAWNLASAFHKSGMFGVKSADQALTVLLTGMELGLAPAQSLRGIQVIQGRPSPSADTMAAVCQARPDVCKYFRLVSSDTSQATYETWRVGHPDPVPMTYTIAQAKQAGLAGKDIWKAYPEAMLRARCISALTKAVYQDLILGLYTPEEAEDFDAPASPPPPARTPDAPAFHSTSENALRALRLEKSAPLIALLHTLPAETREHYRKGWLDKYGTSNPKMLDLAVIEQEIARIEADKLEDEADPFDDSAPQAAPVLLDVPVVDEKGHGDS